ncbi:MAG: hypothetical protein SFY66_23510 [Oculatellaceae cyanobacterium bins.114]|nr:hypothetical protein [Oculatellaceae cyanobacterium bins.114]
MTRAVEHIERDIAALEQSVAAIAQDLHTTYSDYLTDLGQAVKRQLVLAAYHICTQGYPDRFLTLSLSQRQELQQTLKQLAQRAQTQLVNRLRSFDEIHLPPEEDLSEHELSEPELSYEELADDDLSDDDLDEELDDEEQLDEERLREALLRDGALTGEISGTFFTVGDRSSGESQARFEWSETSDLHDSALHEASMAHDFPPAQKVDAAQAIADPRWVVSWQENLEKGIATVLQTLSYAANQLLQESDILPTKLAQPILEVAAKAGAEIASGPPNLLNLLIESEGDGKTASKMTHIMTIRLRLSEIEFADPTLGAWRSKIRGVLARLNQVGRDYQKKHREKAIATAEAAWRSTWFDD